MRETKQEIVVGLALGFTSFAICFYSFSAEVWEAFHLRGEHMTEGVMFATLAAAIIGVMCTRETVEDIAGFCVRWALQRWPRARWLRVHLGTWGEFKGLSTSTTFLFAMSACGTFASLMTLRQLALILIFATLPSFFWLTEPTQKRRFYKTPDD